MRGFTELILRLNDLQTEPESVKTLVSYFSKVHPEDGAWALWLLLGKKLKPAVSRRSLQQWMADLSGYPDWLIEKSNHHVGNVAEAFSLLTGNQSVRSCEIPLWSLMEEKLLPLKDWDAFFQKQLLESLWSGMSQSELFILMQILSGSLRTNCSYFLVIRALANACKVEFPVLLYRLQGQWQPTGEFFLSLSNPEETQLARTGCPYPIREPGSLQANLVLVYAYASGMSDQEGFSAYALAAAREDELIPVVKVPSAMDGVDQEFLDEWIQANTLTSKGPVRTTPAQLVLRISFDGVYTSDRHKCGLVLDNPQLISLEKGKSRNDLTRLSELQSYTSEKHH